MEFKEAKEQFVQSWGILGSSWGISRTMAQIHALLLISPEPLTTEDVMEELNISRGNANMNLRALIDWGIVMKEHKAGERREFFKADKDILRISKQIARERRKREIEPALAVLNQVKDFEGNDSASEKEFKTIVAELESFAGSVNGVLERYIYSDKYWFFNVVLKLMK